MRHDPGTNRLCPKTVVLFSMLRVYIVPGSRQELLVSQGCHRVN